MSEKLRHVEFEVKFKVEGDLVYEFKKLVQTLSNIKEFIYVESNDVYFIKGDEFIRHRFDPKDSNSRQELTYKRKNNPLNNINRIEHNVRCDGNKLDVVEAFCSSLGFNKGFTISKLTHIYVLDDATLPFYTVIDEKGGMQHFIEIEVDEALLHNLTEDEAWQIVNKYEKLLAPLGITPQKRLKKSLFEMYRVKETT